MFKPLLYSALVIVGSLSQLGCVERPYGDSTGPRWIAGRTTFPRGNTTYPRSNSTYPRSNSTYPRSNSTYPRSRGNSTYPSVPRSGNSTFPESPRKNNSTFPRRPRGLPRGNTTFPSASNSFQRSAKTLVAKVESIDATRSFYLAQAEAQEVDPRDWWYWRGPDYNGVSLETGLIDDYDPAGGDGSNLLWKRDIGGRSTPVTLRGRLYTMARDKPEMPLEGEKVVCLDLNTGKTLWENRFNVWLSDVPKERVGWSSVIADPHTGNIYALGVCGYFQCINGETGKTIWSLPLHERFGFLSTYGGRTNFPIICEDLVIISAIVIGWGDMAKPAHRFVAFNKHTGDVVWFNGTRLLPYDTTYSSGTLAVLNGQKALVFGSGDGGIWALQPRTGQPIWKYRFSRRGLNVSPLVVGDTIFSGHSEENIAGVAMGSVVSLDALGKGDVTKTGENWKVEELMMGKSSPILIGDRLYCFDDRAKLHVLDIKTGDRVAPVIRLGNVMRASPLYADGKIYAVTNNGRYYILKPDDKLGAIKLKIGRFEGEACFASPICSHGKVIIQTSAALYCFEDEDQEHGISPSMAKPKEAAIDVDAKPVHLQVVPAEILTKPGAEHKFTVRLFNAHGQLLKESEAEFSLDGPGKIDKEGNFVASEEAQHVALVVNAKVGELTGQARIRVVPNLPWRFTFDGLDNPPVTWVGARYRHVIRDVDGSKMMVKVTTIPKGTRSRSWFGHSDVSDYTIQADIKAAIANNKMPDIGLVAQGYTIDLKGAAQTLQIRRWVTELKMAKEIDFSWKPDTWYTMKLRASLKDGKAVLQGKIWPRGEDEPEDWTIEAVDPTPNTSGSPGLYGNATDAELYLDNITVTPNGNR